MDFKDAVILENFFPHPNYVELRSGSSNHLTDSGSAISGNGGIQTLMAYNTGSGAQKLFAANTIAIYDATSAGSIGAGVVTSMTSGRWQYINFSTTGGAYLYAVNGADKPQLYDGTNWTAIDSGSTPAITGVTTTNLIHVNAFKNRIWFIEKTSLKAWYLPTSAVGGAATLFDFRSIFTRGGYLMAMGTWTLDAGYGMDDHAVFITSEGEVAVYRGTDPASAATWALVGKFQVGAPIGRRCLAQYGSDLAVICKDGLILLSKALLTSQVNKASSLTDKILPLISADIVSYGSQFGWQVVLHPVGDALVLNVPQSSTVAHQYVMNTVSGAWCKFTGWNALCFERYNDNIYFGTSSAVVKAFTGVADNSTNINGNALQAFNYLGKNTALKHCTMMRPMLGMDIGAGILVGVNFDFDTSDPSGSPILPTSAAGVWDTGTWDSAVWGGDLTISKNWLHADGIGYAVAPHIKAQTKVSRVVWYATDLVYQEGNVLLSISSTILPKCGLTASVVKA